MKELKIEPGKYYRTRNGHKVRIYATDAGGDYPTHGAVLYSGGWEVRAWTSNGIYSMGDTSASDIISEWIQTIDDIGFDKSCLPKWAKFICMNNNGRWWWSNTKPTHSGEFWKYELIFGIIPDEHAPKNYQGDWKDSLFEVV